MSGNVLRKIKTLWMVMICLLFPISAIAGYVNSWTSGNLTWKLSSMPLPGAQFGGNYDDVANGDVTINIIGFTPKKESDIYNLTIPQTVVWKSGGSKPNIIVAVNKINASAFLNRTALRTVTIPGSYSSKYANRGVLVIEQPCFRGCSNLTEIKYDIRDDWADSPYRTVDGVLYDRQQQVLKKYPEGKIGDVYTVPSSVRKLTEYCLSNTKLTTIYFQGDAPEADNTTFRGSVGLKAICYPQGSTGWTDSWKGVSTYAIPKAVTGISASQGTSMDGITITWSPNSIATSYVVYRRPVSGGNSVQLATVSGSTAYVDTIAEKGVKYYYSVTAKNGKYAGVASSEVQGWLKETSANETIVVRYNLQGGSFPYSLIPTSLAKSFTRGTAIGELDIPRRSGYAFDSWWSDPVGGFKITATTVLYASTEIYARWIKIEEGVFKSKFKWNCVRNKMSIVDYLGDDRIVIVPSEINGITVTGICANAFINSTNLVSVIVPQSIKCIEECAFYGCQLLRNVIFLGDRPTMGEGVFSLEYMQMAGIANSGKRYYFPNLNCVGYVSRNAIGWKIGVDSNALIEIAYHDEYSNGQGYSPFWDFEWDIDNGCAMVAKYVGNDNVVRIPSAVCDYPVIGIADRAFADCTSIISILIPDCVTSIGEAAFNGCNSLPDVAIPYTVTSIKKMAFSNCSSLTNVVFVNGQNNVEVDVRNAFEETPWLENVDFDIPDNDNFDEAKIITGQTGVVAVVNAGATEETFESGLDVGTATVWWKWTSPINGILALDTLGSDFDTILGIYGRNENDLHTLAHNDDSEELGDNKSAVTVVVNENTTYYIAVGGYAGTSGEVNLNWRIVAEETMPVVTNDSEVLSAVYGLLDVKLIENITTATDYAAYRTWALGLEGVTPEQVKASPHAWLSYALDTEALIASAPKEGDIVIDIFEGAATDGAFEFTVKIDGIEVGENALEANIRKVFDIEGVEKLVSGGAGFSLDNVEVNAAAPENGNVKFTVTPKMENGEKPDSFFFRVKMK